jgi:hypothetical protein
MPLYRYNSEMRDSPRGGGYCIETSTLAITTLEILLIGDLIVRTSQAYRRTPLSCGSTDGPQSRARKQAGYAYGPGH